MTMWDRFILTKINGNAAVYLFQDNAVNYSATLFYITFNLILTKYRFVCESQFLLLTF